MHGAAHHARFTSVLFALRKVAACVREKGTAPSVPRKRSAEAPGEVEPEARDTGEFACEHDVGPDDEGVYDETHED